ncbi:GTP 3',8-cyclase MoaA [Cohaesibacter haloalkalitolerans]|uniref:GTP 3',8-cyclase MoaA n=1 Tax=Cohaesibacter haloalkalitolerans TaxID=1162980 RepID=UPI000E65D07F|nr:GTP 3',8-cyclase MoaA [Cohaesibacter haloalkalitolerans]
MAFIDPYGRTIDYVRLSLTDRCNLRCFYCLPKGTRGFAPSDTRLTFDEIERVIRAFAVLGVHRVRLTGGEPLVRKGVAQLVARLHQIPGVDDMSMSTNALLLEPHAEALFAAGVGRLNVSLDSINVERFARITNGGNLDHVLKGLFRARQEGFDPIKINMLVMKGINDDEVVPMARFCIENGFTLRYIETMPMGAGGMDAVSRYLPLDVVEEALKAEFNLIDDISSGGGPARYKRIAGSETKIGFITPLSRHFCASCNRVRLGADGTLHLCLGNSHSVGLREPLRQGIDDEELVALIRKAIALKPWQHNFNQPKTGVNRSMAATGG